MTEPLQISAQGTPNPNAAKFMLNRTVATQGTTYKTATDDAPAWAKALLAISGVTQVFALQNFISVTKTPEVEWNVIGPQVEQVLRRAFD